MIVITPEAKDHLWSALTSLASAPAAERTLTGDPTNSHSAA
jgi:type IV secretion system protein VirB4